MIYRIQAGAIDTKYAAKSILEALRMYTKDAGYNSYEDLKKEHGPVDSIKEVPVVSLSDAELLQFLIETKGWNQTEAAAQLGYGDNSRISEIVNERRYLGGPARKFIEHLVEKLDTHVS